MTTTYVAGTGYWEAAKDGKEVWVCKNGKNVTPLPPRLDIANKSPTGFAWGYGGSGPMQLAIAILAHAMGEAVARRLYHQYCAAVIQSLPQKEGFVITEESVLAFVQERPLPAEMTEDERSTLEWLGEEEFSQYGEVHGRSLDALVERGLAEIHNNPVQGAAFIAPQGRGPMYRAVSLTEAGRAALRRTTVGA
jgi:hypothetical protein